MILLHALPPHLIQIRRCCADLLNPPPKADIRHHLADYFLEPLVLKAWAYAVPVAAIFALLSCLGFFFSRLLFCSLLISISSATVAPHYITDRQFSTDWGLRVGSGPERSA